MTSWGLRREVEDVDQMPGSLNACVEHGFCSAVGHLWNLEIRPTQTCFGEAVPHLLGALQGRGLWASSDDSGMWKSGGSHGSQVNSMQSMSLLFLTWLKFLTFLRSHFYLL